MSEVKKTMDFFRTNVNVIAHGLLNRTINYYASGIKATYGMSKPLYVDGKKITKVQPSTIAKHVVTTIDGADGNFTGSISVSNKNPTVLEDARRHELFGMAPFKMTIYNFRNPDGLEHELRREPDKVEALTQDVQSFKDIEVKPG